MNDATQPEPCNIVIFGAGGDLSKRKLLPALARMQRWNLIAPESRIIGILREGTWNLDTWKAYVRQSLEEFRSDNVNDEESWGHISQMLELTIGDLGEAEMYQRLRQTLKSANGKTNVLFYLAIPPDWYEATVSNLHAEGLLDESDGFRRIVIEKPFGNDLNSARELNRRIGEYAGESQIYRIDHYLGKEGVQNLMVFRFANTVFEPLWNRNYIDHVQISVSESLGVEYRAGYYEKAGALVDMIQSHLIQVMTLVAMESPISLEGNAVRDEKVKILKSVRPIPVERVNEFAVRAQYAGGTRDGKRILAYRDEEGVDPSSTIDTFAAVKLYIDNWRWQDVPFLLRTGKRLPERVSEITIRFKQPPKNLFSVTQQHLPQNELIFRLHPEEGMIYLLNAKLPGLNDKLRELALDAPYAVSGADSPEAYETLLHDVLLGQSALFSRADEVEESWRIVAPIMEAWKERRGLHFYEANTWDIPGMEELMEDCVGCWRDLSATHQHGYTPIS
ncbi:glucose-6-phosphate 1-dehydrogenase [Mariprofundus ferrinatatus]|uniref:Glucose-6-phosphate 1-dehydrogenase n=1 Tax=Mariprofundus ferrinatatus TaxID=1921087 RepID=A0A2K8L1V1_9PROT|nr:glucose-6-phosphate dehydrogenase [Mariprofundus ferrinatatus]ATX81295.1 glucose-6-phosphate 1-dehydrogenase [Mariprofundus ferrinatatus]